MKNPLMRGMAGLLMLMVAACSGQPDAVDDRHNAGTVSVSRMLFEEREPGFEAYPLRVLVSATHVRIDDNLDEGDFILYERASGTIHNVTREDRTILEMPSAAELPAMPAELRVEAIETSDAQAPAVAGHRPLHTVIRVNDSPCYQLVHVPGVLERELAGVAEYTRALARRQQAQLDTLLPGQGDPCYLVRHVFAADRPWTGGVPLEQWDEDGYRRTLVDFGAQEAVDGALFALPEGYESYRLENSAN